MSEVIATSYSYETSKLIDRASFGIGMFSFENATSQVAYNMPSYFTYLVIKHYEIPTATYYDAETIEVVNVDFLAGDADLLESEELITAQKEHDARFLEPFNFKNRRKTKIIFK